MTANTDEHEQLRLIFLEQVGHLITDGTIETRSLKRAGISFACGNLHAAFLAWQAARRAPVVPDALREAAQRAHDWMDSQADSQSKGNYHSFDLFCLRQERDALAEALAAAPQPPEVDHIPDAGKMVAAPVQLPEPQAEIEVRSMKTYLDLSIHEWRDTLPDGTYKVYTEQQVRQLLAAQEQST